jgi:hypothetical protein
MCGIVGFATNMRNGFRSDELDAFYNMLYFDALRGLDSTGVMGVDYIGNVQVHKEASHALDFLRNKELFEFKRDAIARGVFLVGHNRAATRGTITDANAHPFNIDNKIVLVQNGTWNGDHKHIKDTEVDTEALAHLIHEHNDDVLEAFKKINAAYALVWYNVEEKTIYMCRNGQRPLFIAKAKSGSMAWCSEPGFMRLACARNNIELETVYQLEEQKLLRIKLKEDKSWEVLELQDVPTFRYTPTNYSNADYWKNREAANTAAGTKEVPHLPSPRPVLALPSNNPIRNIHPEAYIERHFSDLAPQNIPEHAIDNITCGEVMSRMGTLMQSKQPVELMDYWPANNHRNCSVWHVYGHLVLPDEADKMAHVAVHWLVHDKSESEIMEYVAHALYSVKPTHCRVHRTHTNKNIIGMLASEIAPFEIGTVTDALH